MIDRRSMLAATLGALSPALMAQTGPTDWPRRAVKMLVGFPPGQGSDLLARIYAEELQKANGQPFVVDNRPGAGATLAARDAAKSAPDGYTVLYTSSGPLTVAPHLYPSVGFDPLNDLESISLVGRAPLILLVRSSSPITSLSGLVAAAASRQLSCGSGGNGVTNHLALELFKQVSGASLLHVPYKGAAPAMTDLISGQIDCMFETSAAALTHVTSGRLRAIAVSSTSRYSELPQVPTVAETYAGFNATTWATLSVPRGTPAAISQKLATQLAQVQKDPAVREKMIRSGVEPVQSGSPAEVQAYVRAEYEKWGNIIRKANIKLD